MTFLNSSKCHHILTATLGFLIPLGVTLPSLASTVTTVDFSGFNKQGNVNSSFDDATLSTDSNSDADTLANFLGVETDKLDDPNDPFFGSAVQGSAIQQEFDANAGDTFRFDWTFTTEADPNNINGTGDYAFVTTNNQVPFEERIVSISEGSFNFNSNENVYETSGTFEGTFASDNPTVAIGIVELQGSPETSTFTVSNGEIAEPVPFETSSEVGAFVVAGGIASIAWRRHRRRSRN